MYIINDWQRYEVNSKGQAATEGNSLRVGPLNFIRLKVHGHSQGNGYRKLLCLARERSMEVFGIFCKFLEISGNSGNGNRGVLLAESNGKPATKQDLAFLLSVPIEQIDHAIEILSDARLEWLLITEETTTEDKPKQTKVIQYNTIQGAGNSPEIPGNAHDYVNSKFSLEECKSSAILIGVTPEQAEAAFHFYNSQGWKKSNNMQITDIKSALISWRNNGHKFAPKGNANGKPTEHKTWAQKDREVIAERTKKLIADNLAEMEANGE